MLQFLSGGCHPLLEVLQILVFFSEAVQLGSDVVSISPDFVYRLVKPSNLFLWAGARDKKAQRIEPEESLSRKGNSNYQTVHHHTLRYEQARCSR